MPKNAGRVWPRFDAVGQDVSPSTALLSSIDHSATVWSSLAHSPKDMPNSIPALLGGAAWTHSLRSSALTLVGGVFLGVFVFLYAVFARLTLVLALLVCWLRSKSLPIWVDSAAFPDSLPSSRMTNAALWGTPDRGVKTRPWEEVKPASAILFVAGRIRRRRLIDALAGGESPR